MIIGIDITTLVYSGSGVANYTYNLVKNLLIVDKKNKYRLFFSSPRIWKKYAYLEEFKKLGAEICRFPFPLKIYEIIWGKLNIIPVEWLIGKVDLFFSSDFLRPPTKIKTITTVHDLVWKIYPLYHEDFIIKAHENKLKKTIEYGDEIIVDSLSTKSDLLKFYPQLKENTIHVIYPGISDQFKPVNKTTINSSSKYLLYVGAIEPRKNLITAIEVFNEFIKDKKYSDFQFIISGKAGWSKELVFEKVKQLNLENKVKFIGFVKDEELPALYSNAKLTIYLSSYEGFGLPPLESLACGTPVIAGNNSSMKETLSKDFLVDVKDKKTILEKMKALLENKIKIDSASVRKRFDWTSRTLEFLKIIQGLPRKT